MSKSTHADQRHQYWHEHINAWREYGHSGIAYCQLHQLVYHQFSYWRRKFQDSHAQLTPCEPTGFVRVLGTGTQSPTGLSLALPNGLVIQDIGDSNVDVVRQLLAVL